MTHVWSKRLVGPVNIPAGQITLGTVPAGRTWVVKNVTTMNDGNTVTARILVAIGSTGVVANRVLIYELGPKTWRSENTTLTFHAGEVLTALAVLGPAICNLTMSGYELDGP